MKNKEIYILRKSLPWFGVGMAFEIKGKLEDGTRNWHKYDQYVMQDIPQRELLDHFFDYHSEWFDKLKVVKEKHETTRNKTVSSESVCQLGQR